MTFSILTVCTGNLCRSPYAQYRLAYEAFQQGVDVEVRSAGTHAVQATPYHPMVVEQLQHRGIDATAGRSSYLGPQQLATAQLILVASRSHLTHVARLHPPSLRYALTMREAAYLGSNPPRDEPTTLAQHRFPPGFESDLEDPIQGPPEAFAAMARDVDALVPSMLDFIARRKAATR